MDRSDEVIGVRGDNRERPDPLLGPRSLPALPNASEGKVFAALLPDGIRLLWLQSLDRPTLKEVIDKDEASPASVRIAEGGE